MEPLLIATVAVLAAGLIVGTITVPRWRERRRRRKAALGLEQAVILGGQAAVKGAIRTAQRVREEGMGAMLREPVEALATWADVEHPELRRISRNGTVSILFTDIEDSTALNHELGDRRWLKVLGAHDKLVRSAVEKESGHIVKHQGDGFMVAFAETDEALRCAIAIQRSLETGSGILKKTPVRVRIGVHSGEAVSKKGDLYGRNVALAARVAAEACGGEILASDEARDLSDDESIEFGKPRKVELKGLGPHQLLEVSRPA